MFANLVPLVALTDPAAAQEPPAPRPRPPVSVPSRGLTIGRWNGAVGVEPALVRTAGALAYATAVPIRFGVTPGVEVFASPTMQSVDPVLRDPALGVITRFNRGDVQAGARVAGDLSLFGATKAVTLQAGIPVRIRTGGRVAIDTGAHALVPLVPAVALGLSIPAGAQLGLTERVYLAASTGLRVADLSHAADTWVAPASATVGGSLPRDGVAFVDAGVRGSFADLRATEAWSVALIGRIHFYP